MKNNYEKICETDVLLEKIPLIQDDPEAMRAIQMLRNRGYTPKQVWEAMIDGKEGR